MSKAKIERDDRDALRNLVPIVEFKKQHFSMGVFTFFELYKWYQIAQRITIYKPIFYESFYFATPENKRKPLFFWCFQGVLNGKIGVKRV